MGISIVSAKFQASKARGYADDVSRVKNNINNKRSDINSAWHADEVKYINAAIEKMNQKLTKVSSELDAIASDIVSVAYEIKREEEEKERAKAAAAAAAAKK